MKKIMNKVNIIPKELALMKILTFPKLKINNTTDSINHA